MTANIKKAANRHQLLKQFTKYGDDFNHIHCAAFWGRFGQLSSYGAEHSEWLQPVVDKSLPFVHKDFGRAELTGTAHGLAKAGLGKMAEVQPLWTALTETCIERLHEFTPRELGTLAWSLGKSRLQNALTDELLEAIARASLPRLSGFAPQGLANLAWAYATAGQPATRAR